MKCRYCASTLSIEFLDLGNSPPSNAFLKPEDLSRPEKWFPLRVMVCSNCWLVQTVDYAGAEELFSKDYTYFSSYSSTWLDHAKNYVQKMSDDFGLDKSKTVVEIGANDGYLLQFVKNAGIPCVGIEPTKSTAEVARKKGIEIIEDFFSDKLAEKLVGQKKQADLIVANNVLAHVPDINSFVKGIYMLLKPEGIATFEFPHLIELIRGNQFDTIYHEHFSYLSLSVVKEIFAKHNLLIFDVDKLPTHGSSLRVYASRKDSAKYKVSSKVSDLLILEEKEGVKNINYYTGFQRKANKVKNDFLGFLLDVSKNSKKVVGYGAAAKGNTLLNYAGIKKDFIPFVVDKNPEKQGKFLPGSRIPIVSEAQIKEYQPNYIVIFPWNIKEEIMQQLSYVKDWGGKFIIAVPEFNII